MTRELHLYLDPPSDFGPTMHVASCYITCRGRLLLLQSAPHKAFGGSYSAPGGKLEPLETPLTAVLRETFEETGLLIDSREVRHHSTFYVRYPNLDFVYHVFVLKIAAPPEEILLSPREHVAYVWASPSEVVLLPLMPAADQCFRHVYGKDLIF